MTRIPEKICPAPVATTEASAVNRAILEALMGLPQQREHILVRRGCVASLKLHGLTRSRKSSYRDDSRIRIRPNQIAHQKITSCEILQILVNDQPDKKISASFL